LSFQEVDISWKKAMDLASANANVLDLTETAGLLDMLVQKNGVLARIGTGLAAFAERKRLVFPRLLFVSSAQV
jgi:hypothetical protein